MMLSINIYIKIPILPCNYRYHLYTYYDKSLIYEYITLTYEKMTSVFILGYLVLSFYN